jgi:dipeptidyl aminopeptidase/acylaminoacyl peptidase
VNDPIATLLGELDAPVPPRQAFGQGLWGRVRMELEAGEPGTRQARRRAAGARRGRRSRLRVVLVAIAVLLVLASAATATYVAVSDGGGNAPGLLDSPSNGPASLMGIDVEGQVHTIWHCPSGTFCGDVKSVAWAPDGRRVAIALTEFGGRSPYPGLHVIDTVSGRDTKLFGLTPLLVAPPGSTSHRKAAKRAYENAIATFGCLDPDELAWSPDGSRIAYVCIFGRHGRIVSEIHVVNADGTHPRRLRTGVNAAWPSWSPSGSRMAFSTDSTPLVKVKNTGAHWNGVRRSIIYAIDLTGAHRRRLAFGAAPAWSPDGSAIAYRSACGGRIRLVAPDGADLTPEDVSARCPGIGPAGWPTWGPGHRLAIGTPSYVYLIDADGRNLQRLNASSVGFGTGSLRPIWQPAAPARS